MRILLFEDALVNQLYPIALSRPAFAISCGSLRLWDIVRQLGQPLSWIVRPHLRGLLEAETAEQPQPANGQGVLLVNAAAVPSVTALGTLRDLLSANQRGQLRTADGRLAAALLGAEDPLPADDASPDDLEAYLTALDLPALEHELRLFEWPHDVIREHLAVLPENLAHRLETGCYREMADGVFAAPGARVGQYVVTDTTDGPIILESGASIGPYCFLSGPAHLGPGARVIEHSAIKDAVALGHTTKIGGEIEASVIEPFTNKQHHGFLGHSYLGSWINLGAGTCNSDLKNTYGQVNMTYQGRKVATGMQFVGCIMGDYSKSAINTGLFTGKVIGVCSMLYGFVTTNVPSFCNYGRSFGQVTEIPVSVVEAMQARMFARRKVSQQPRDTQLLRDMYDLTRHERQLTGEPLTL